MLSCGANYNITLCLSLSLFGFDLVKSKWKVYLFKLFFSLCLRLYYAAVPGRAHDIS
jgi:hypothetical protein